MSYIMEKLYIGDADDASNTTHLRQQKFISHILTLERRPLPRELTQDFTYKYVHALDMEDFDLLSSLEDCLKFIDEGRLAEGVFVHCFAGQSRSGMIVTAYVMKTLELTLADALALVRKHRPTITPNEGFMKQLELFEQMDYNIDLTNMTFRTYRLELLSKQILTAKAETQVVPAGYMSADPTTSISTDAVYKCHKCRRALFRASTVMLHEKGPGERAFRGQFRIHKSHPSKLSHCGGDSSQDDATLCGASIFIEPVEWMKHDILSPNGKLFCPNRTCVAKLGTFDWAGDRCSCGSWVTPAFHMQKSKLDFCQIRAPVSVVKSENGLLLGAVSDNGGVVSGAVSAAVLNGSVVSGASSAVL